MSGEARRVISAETSGTSAVLPRICVEVGVGSATGYLDGALEPKDYYIGIENGYDYRHDPDLSLPLGVGFMRLERRMRTYRSLPHVCLLSADGVHTPIKSEKVDEVLFTNVFSDPLLADWISPEDMTPEATVLRLPSGEPKLFNDNRSSFYVADSLGERREALLREAARIVRLGGRIVINSHITPEFVSHDRLVGWFRTHGFTAVELLNPEDGEAWVQKTTGYRMEPGAGVRFLIATKTETEVGVVSLLGGLGV